MTAAVLDASVVVKWFHAAGERHVAQARALRKRFELGELDVVAPSLLPLELVNVAGRRWSWEAAALDGLAIAFEQLGFALVDADLRVVARWTAAGLSACDAAYVAVAEERELPLVTDDERILAIAPAVAVPLASADGERPSR